MKHNTHAHILFPLLAHHALCIPFGGAVPAPQVHSLGQSSSDGKKGPAGVAITLKSKETPDAAIKATTTSHGGAFLFDNVLPGTYEVVASHPSWTFIKVRNSFPPPSRITHKTQLNRIGHTPLPLGTAFDRIAPR